MPHKLQTLLYPPIHIQTWMDEYLVSRSKRALWVAYFKHEPMAFMGLIFCSILGPILTLVAFKNGHYWLIALGWGVFFFALIFLKSPSNAHRLAAIGKHEESFTSLNLDKKLIYEALTVFCEKYGFFVEDLSDTEPFYVYNQSGEKLIMCKREEGTIMFSQPENPSLLRINWNVFTKAHAFLPEIALDMLIVDVAGIPRHEHNRKLVFKRNISPLLIILAANNKVLPQTTLVLSKNNVPHEEWSQYAGLPAEWVESLVKQS